MPSERVELTGTPVQVTDGSETAYISCKKGIFFWADSPVQPTDLSVFHEDSKMSVNPPFQIWVWNGATGMSVVVSKRTAASQTS